MSERLFMGHHHSDRDIAVLFLVDMNDSTMAWINDVQRETLLLSESLETLGDRYAIYGFAGMTRKRCELYRLKRFTDAYDANVLGCISGIRARDYLPHLYGAARYTSVDDVARLPYKVSDIYRRLTR